MFRSKTVFVLGAGASQEVGLPTGDDLKKKIASKIDIRFDSFQQKHGDYRITEALREHVKSPDGRNGDINPHLHMAWQLCEALPLEISIDNLLDKHRGNKIAETCGKLGIVSSILEAEKASRLHYKPTEERKLNFSALIPTDTQAQSGSKKGISPTEKFEEKDVQRGQTANTKQNVLNQGRQQDR